MLITKKPEFAHPYHLLAPHVTIDVASPAGGEAPLDPSGVEMFKTDDLSVKFLSEKQELWKNTIKLENVNAEDYDGIFFVGGHGRKFSPTSNRATNEWMDGWMDE